MRPNVVVLGFKNDWMMNASATIDYFNIIHDALHLKYGIGILRLQTGLNASDFFQPGMLAFVLCKLLEQPRILWT
jgi:hypothetical protein